MPVREREREIGGDDGGRRAAVCSALDYGYSWVDNTDVDVIA